MSNSQDRALVPTQSKEAKPYLDRADIVIIGNGIAGLTAAVEARRLDPEKRIVIITDQIHPTINTPALKQFAVGKLTREQLLAYPPGTERTERIHVVSGRVEEIHAQSKYVTLSGGRGFGYECLLIATGSTPTKLPENLPGRNFDGVLALHRLQDYLDFRRRLSEVSEAVVIGGGVLANETVMGLLFWGIKVHWLIRGSTFMPRMFDPPASEMILKSVREAGAMVYTNTEASGIVGRVGSVAGVITNQQQMIPCQLVLTCTGTQPVAGLASRCTVPMKSKKGILVDDKLRTSVRDVYAAGDVAALRNPLTGEYEPRALWYAAVLQGRMAGAVMTGHTELAREPFGAAWHATHLGDLYMLSVGEPLSEERGITVLTDSSPSGYRRMAIADDRLVGYLSLGSAQPDSLALKRIIDEGHSIRALTKALLKGNFDARGHISQIRSRTAQGMLTRRLSTNLANDQVQDVLPFTEQQPRLPVAKQTAALSPSTARELRAPAASAAPEPVSTYVERRQSVERPPSPARSASNEERRVIYEEEVSPFSGNLPTVAPQVVEEMSPFTGNLPTVAPQVVEEVSPFTGNLPAFSSASTTTGGLAPFTRTRPVAEEVNPSTGKLSGWAVQAAPTQQPAPKRKLWAYVEASPAASTGSGQRERR